MPSFQDIIVASQTMQTIGLLIMWKYGWLGKSVGTPLLNEKSESFSEEFMAKHAKAAVPPPSPFSEYIRDWSAWKKGTKETLGVMGLL